MQNQHRKNTRNGTKKKIQVCNTYLDFCFLSIQGQNQMYTITSGQNFNLKMTLHKDVEGDRNCSTNSQVMFPPFFPCLSSVWHLSYFLPPIYHMLSPVWPYLPPPATNCNERSYFIPFGTTHFAIPYWFPPSAQIFGSSPDLLPSPPQDRTTSKSRQLEEPMLSFVHCHRPLLLQPAALWFYRRMVIIITGSQQLQRLLT